MALRLQLVERSTAMKPVAETTPETLQDAARAAKREIEALRAALEVRFAALEAAFNRPDEGESLEKLVLDLCRTATDEAQAAAQRACTQAQFDVEAQVTAVRAVAQKALDMERAAGAESRSAREQAVAALEQERKANGTLRRTLEETRAAFERQRAALDEARVALEAERTAAAKVGAAIEDGQRQRAGLEQQKIESQAARDQLAEDVERERTTSNALRIMLGETRGALERTHTALEEAREMLETERMATADAHGRLEVTQAALETARQELEAARQQIEAIQTAHREELESVQARCEMLEQQRQEAERAWKDAEARYAAVVADDMPLVSDESAMLTEMEPAEAESLTMISGPESGENLPVGHSPTRRANRYQVREDVHIQIDSEDAVLVDVSTRGAQVLSVRTLKPNSIVKVRLEFDEHPVTCRAKVVWAQLEPPSRHTAIRYRAGLNFTNIDESSIQRFVAHHAARPQPA
jgi:hypothetical protein